jgi:hypothetical protein
MTRYEQYSELVRSSIKNCLSEKNCQPILFIGSGFTRRYANGPNWHELLKEIGSACHEIAKEYEFYKQTFGNPMAIGEEFAKKYHTWAWVSGRQNFPEELFSGENSSQIYLKYQICKYVGEKISDFTFDTLNDNLKKEIEILQKVNPHTIITTNYDSLIEKIFPDYEPVIGQKVLRNNNISVGEIFKIHGCVTKSDSLVLTTSDFEIFQEKQKYLSAKLLTFFAEHPLVFIGYSAEDPNIKNILSNIDEILTTEGRTISNIFLVKWDSELDEDSFPPVDVSIQTNSEKSVRINAIHASSFQWVYESFSSDLPIEPINPKILRSILARTYKLVRTDIPRRNLEVDFSILERAASSGEEFAKIYGVSQIDSIVNGTNVNATWPYLITQMSIDLGLGNNHTKINKIFKEINQKYGIDIKSSDNRYHYAVKTGKSQVTRKYSEAAKKLIIEYLAGQELQINL